jgi:hypothetical protein
MNTLQDRINRELQRRNMPGELFHLGRALESAGLIGLALGTAHQGDLNERLRKGPLCCEYCYGRGALFNIDGGPPPLWMYSLPVHGVMRRIRSEFSDVGYPETVWWDCPDCEGSGSQIYKGSRGVNLAKLTRGESDWVLTRKSKRILELVRLMFMVQSVESLQYLG